MTNNIDKLEHEFKNATIKTGVSNVIAIGSIILFSTASYVLDRKPLPYQDIILGTTGISMLLTTGISINNTRKYCKAAIDYDKAIEKCKKNK